LKRFITQHRIKTDALEAYLAAPLAMVAEARSRSMRRVVSETPWSGGVSFTAPAGPWRRDLVPGQGALRPIQIVTAGFAGLAMTMEWRPSLSATT
jgi:hypothetical protein